MKTIVVTGAAGGIGSKIMYTFVERGWQVIAIDNRPLPQPSQAVFFKQCDLADPAAIRRVAREIDEQYASVDVLVNCAAAQNIGAVHELPQEEWDQTFAVNVRAPWLLMKELHGALAKAAQTQGQAAVVNINSIHSIATSPGMVAYAASKAALSGLTRSASIEYAKDSIRVNGIVPGAVATPMLVEHLSQAQLDTLVGRQLIPHLIAPDAIVGAIDYLISDAAANITGQELIIDSGVLPQLATEMA